MNENQNLTGRVMKSGFWALGLRMGNRGVGLVRVLILARLLLPEDFGLLGIALLTVAAIETFTVTGFDQALVQREDTEDRFWDTAWLTAAGRGIALAAVVFAAAPAVAWFFDRPDSVWVVRAMAAGPLIRGFSNLGIVRYVREMDFRRRFVYEFGITLVDAAVSIPLAIALRSVWALVLGLIAGQVAGLFISWLQRPVRVSLRFDRGSFSELFGFGRWVTGSSIMNFLLVQGDDVVVGRLLGASSLGLYQMAYRIGTLPVTEAGQVIASVTFPAFSRLRNDRERLRGAFFRVVGIAAMAAVPGGLAIALLGADFVSVVLGPNWTPMTGALVILAVFSAFSGLGTVYTPLLHAIGRPDLPAKIILFRLGILAAAIVPLTFHLGLAGTATAVLVSSVLVNPAGAWIVTRELEGRLGEFARALGPSLVTSAPIVAGGALALLWLDGGLARLAVIAGWSAAAFAGSVYFLEKSGRLGLRSEIAEAGLFTSPGGGRE